MGFFNDLAARLRAGDDPHIAAGIAVGLKAHDLLKEPSIEEKAADISSPRLYVGNLSFEASEDDLREAFSKCGKVVSAEIVRHAQSKRSKGFGFVEMGTNAQAKRAVLKLHGQELLGRKLAVSGAKPAS